MALTIDEFHASLISFGERVQKVRDFIKNEESTKVSLVLPFIGLLGYDISDPTEVSPEYASDFSEKYKNRVDYAILKDMKPIIAIECKSVGNGKKDDRGQLKTYFNASKTVKLGILTDGIVYDCFVDSQEPNLMDDDPFLSVDFSDAARGQLSDTVLEGLFALTKGAFDPEMVSDNARRSITHRAFYDYLNQQFVDPDIEFTRFLMKEVDIKHVRAAAVEGYRAIAKAAFTDVFTSHVLKRLEISGMPSRSGRPDPVPEPAGVSDAAPAAERHGIVTTEAELRAFEAIRLRLAFLAAGNTDIYDAIGRVSFRDYQGKMAVFYGQERKGRLLNLLENRNGSIRYELSDGVEPSIFDEIVQFDDRLKQIFLRRIQEVKP